MKTILLYIKRHYSLIILDLVVYVIAYCLAVLIRYAVHLPITHGELFLKYGILSLGIYFVVEIASKNLNGVLYRSVVGETRSVGLQMLITWSIYTMFLYLIKPAYHFSRLMYGMTFVLCFLFILVGRTVWKMIVRYTRLNKKVSPKLLVVCEASRADKVLLRILPGDLQNLFNICAVVMNDRGEPPKDYVYQTCVQGLEHIDDYTSDHLLQYAYVDLDDAEEETQVITRLLDAGVVVHRSLGDSEFHYASQGINYLGGKYVITIEDMRTSMVRTGERFLRSVIKKKRSD